MGMVYLVNAISPSMFPIPCRLVLNHINTDEAKELLEYMFYNAIGHAGTAAVVSKLLDKEIKANRANIYVNYNDRLIVFALKKRIEEGRVLSEDEINQIGYTWCLVEVEELKDD